MNPKIRSTAAAMFILAGLSNYAACSSQAPAADDDTPLAEGEGQLPKVDDGDPIPDIECSDCVPDKSSPKGGYMTCNRAPRKRACVPPAPPPPPPTTAPCTTTTEGGTCYRLCCTSMAGGSQCSALPCSAGTSATNTTWTLGLVKTMK